MEWSWVKPNFINDTRLLVANDPYSVTTAWSHDVDHRFDKGHPCAWMVMPKPPSREEFVKAEHDDTERRGRHILDNMNNPSVKTTQ